MPLSYFNIFRVEGDAHTAPSRCQIQMQPTGLMQEDKLVEFLRRFEVTAKILNRITDDFRLPELLTTTQSTRYYSPKLDVAWICPSPPNMSRGARMRESTGRFGWATSSSRTSRGVIRRQFPCARRLKTRSVPTRATSTYTSMGCCKIDQPGRSLHVKITFMRISVEKLSRRLS